MLIFALKNDLLLVLGSLEAKRQIKYTRCGRLPDPEPETWESVADLPKLGQAMADQAAGCDQFLIMEKESPIRVETMTMRDGDDRFDVAPLWNPDSVELRVGGEWKDGAIISGSITAFLPTPISQSLARALQSRVKKHFTRVRAYWVGPEALIAFRAGRRLTMAIQSPPEYDLCEVPGEEFDV
jgi:hypothetical protein